MRENWIIKNLGEVCEFYNGQAHEKIINNEGKFIVVNSKFISSNGTSYKRTNKALFPLRKGDIVMVMSDVPNGKALAKCSLIDRNDTYTLNQRICAIRPNSLNGSLKFELKFLFYQLNRNKYFLEFDNGENQTNLRKNDILSCSLFIPPISEQRLIIDVLDKTFNLIDEAKSLTEQKLNYWDELKESILSKALKGDFCITK